MNSINIFKESVTIIPKEKWSIEYIMPAEHCVKSKTGCLQTTYHIHSNAIRVDAEKSGQGMRPSLAMDPSIHAAYLVGDGVRKLTMPVNRACYLHSSRFGLAIILCRVFGGVFSGSSGFPSQQKFYSFTLSN